MLSFGNDYNQPRLRAQPLGSPLGVAVFSTRGRYLWIQTVLYGVLPIAWRSSRCRFERSCETTTGRQARQIRRLHDARYLEVLGESFGGGDQPLRKLLRKYLRKSWLGRLHSCGPSLQNIARIARQNALEGIAGGVSKLDIRLSFASLFVFAIKKALGPLDEEIHGRFPLLSHVIEHKDDLLQFMQTYIECNRDRAKNIVPMHFDPAGEAWRNYRDRCDWLPHLDALQQEIARASELLAAGDPVY